MNEEQIRLDTKMELIKIFHSVVTDLYGKEIADITMQQVNAYYRELRKVKLDQ